MEHLDESAKVAVVEADKIGSVVSGLALQRTLALVGARRAVRAGDRLHLLNMGGVIGCCKGHHSSLSDAIEVEVLGFVVGEGQEVRNISDGALRLRESLPEGCAPLVV